MGTEKKIRKYLPEYWSSDYRTYCPDTIKFTVGQAQQILNTANDVDEDEQARDLAQDIVTKASSVLFTPIQYPPPPTKPKKTTTPKAKHEVLFERFKSRYLKKTQRKAETAKKKRRMATRANTSPGFHRQIRVV